MAAGADMKQSKHPGARMTYPKSIAASTYRNRSRSGLTALALAAVMGFLAAGCQVEEKKSAEPAVVTVNPKYNRLHSHVLVRRIKIPTEANLDFAAYSKNVMLADPEWKAVHLPAKLNLAGVSFGNMLQDIKPILDFTPLTDA